jgi:hypothetical protein
LPQTLHYDRILSMTKKQTTPFSVSTWAKTKDKPYKRGHLDQNLEAQEALREALLIRSQGRSFFSMTDLHKMLSEKKGVKVGVETLRRWIKSNMNDEYTKANF